MVNEDKVSSVRFLKRQDLGYKSQSRKNVEPYFQVPIKYAIYLPD